MTPHQRKIKGIVSKLLEWFPKNARDLPWRRTTDPYAVYVSEIMLQQTQVKTVIPYWTRWMRELPDIQSLARASEAKIHKLWEGLGYYTRVRNMKKAAQQIVEQHGGRFPENYDDVLALPGIGRYTAGAICSIAFNQPTPILDGNVIRVLTRVFGIDGDPRDKKTNAQLWRLAEELVVNAKTPAIYDAFRTAAGKEAPLRPPGRQKAVLCSHLNQSLMELGALICTPRAPQCSICPVRKLCVAFRTNRQEQLPALGVRPKTTARHFIAFVIERNGRYLLRQRPAGVVNAHLWEFPNVECNGERDAKKLFLTTFHGEPSCIEPLCALKHSITRYRITLEAWRAQIGRRGFGVSSSARPENNGIWLTPKQFQSLAFASAHKKLATLAANRNLSGR